MRTENWSGETGIAMAETFGPQPLCSVAWDLAYVSTESLVAVTAVLVRYPSSLEGHAQSPVYGALAEWRSATYAASGPGSLEAAAKFRHLTGSAGIACPKGASTLPLMRGTDLRIQWQTDGGSRDETLNIDAIRIGTLYEQVDLQGGGPDRIAWQPVSLTVEGALWLVVAALLMLFVVLLALGARIDRGISIVDLDKWAERQNRLRAAEHKVREIAEREESDD